MHLPASPRLLGLVGLNGISWRAQTRREMVAFKDDEKRRNAEKKAEAAQAKAAKGQVGSAAQGRSPAGSGQTTRAVSLSPAVAEEHKAALSSSPCAILKKRKTGE